MAYPQNAAWRIAYDERNHHITEMYQGGMSCARIAHEFDLSAPGVRVILERLGIPRRLPWEKRS